MTAIQSFIRYSIFVLNRDELGRAGRAGTTQFIPVKTAECRPKTTTVKTKKVKYSPKLFKLWSKNIRTELTEWIKWLGWLLFLFDYM